MLLAVTLLTCLGTSNGPVLWSDPGRVELIDFKDGAGGPNLAPAPPFTFIKEDMGGTSPKVTVRDSKGVQWRLKGGLEVRVESFITRLIAALGYYAEPTYFLARGRLEGMQPVKRAGGFVKPDGTFTYASLERMDPKARFLKDEHWTWTKSPFVNTPQMNGLKVLVMLLSNWDNKDHRDRYKGSNTSVLACGDQRVYFVNDWGQALGQWGRGGFLGVHKVYDCEAYRRQTPQFITGIAGGHVQFGYEGQHTEDFKRGIKVDDVRWLMGYLGRITDAQIRTGLLVSGASKAEEDCFTKEIRTRIEMLRKIAD